MNAPEKPFVCKSEGCKMSFTNEDHLMVHTKKHDMNLNLGLGMKTNIFVADQTPTPTRFIRNCEEVGLFQDLQNVNPFEETFRRATELVKSGSMLVPNMNISSDDTLHTPHVFPIINSNFNESRNESSMLIQSNTDFDLKTPVIRNESLTNTNSETNTKNNEFDELKHNLELEKIQNSIKNGCIEVITMTGLVNHVKTDEKTNKSKENQKICSKKLVDTNNTAKNSTKQKLKANILKNKTIIKDGPVQIINTVPNIIQLPQSHIPQTVTLTPIVQNPIIVNNPYILGSTNQVYTMIAPSLVQTLSQRSIKNDTVKKSQIKITEKKQNLSPDEEQRQRIKVRNRAASERARKKHKQWINNLVKQNEAFFKTNTILNNEIKTLREEVVKLRTTLLAHADCNVTQSSGDKSNIENVKIETQKSKIQSTTSVQTNRIVMKKIRPNIKPLSLPAIALRNIVTYSNGTSTLIPQTLVNNIPNVLVPVAVQKSHNLMETNKVQETKLKCIEKKDIAKMDL